MSSQGPASSVRTEQVIGIVAAAFLAIGCFLVLRPFLSAVLWAAVVCFSTWPLYLWLEKRLKGRSTLAATLMTLLVALVLVAPFMIVGISLADDVSWVAAKVHSLLAEGAPDPPPWVQKIPLLGGVVHGAWNEMAHNPQKVQESLTTWYSTSKEWITNRGVDLGHGILQLSLSVFIAFFLYRDGAAVAAKVSEVTRRLAGDRTQHLLDVVGGTVKGVVYGILGTALGQGVLAAIGFGLCGVPKAFFWGLMTFFLSFVPMGPPLVWIPASIWLYNMGHPKLAIFLAVWGLCVVSSVDNFLKPYLISRGSNMSFVLVFLGVFGGVIAFGFIGVFLGPTLLAVGRSVLQEWSARKEHELA